MSEYRYEIKATFKRTFLPIILTRLNLHPLGFITPYPDRQINNVYFDSFHLRSFEENLEGGSERLKVRYRWYGALDSKSSGQLEIKSKRNMLGQKLSFPINDCPFSKGLNWKEITANIRRQAEHKGQLFIDSHPQAVLINSYQRRYFASTSGKIRVTIDNDIQVYGQIQSSQPNFKNLSNLCDFLVLEVKCHPTHHLEAQALIDKLPLRISRCSKYVIGRQSLVT